MRKGGPRKANLLKVVTTGKWQRQDLNSEHSHTQGSFMLCFLRNRSQNYRVESCCLHRKAEKSCLRAAAVSPGLLERGLTAAAPALPEPLQKAYRVISTQNAIRTPQESNSLEATGSSWNPHSKKMSQP